MFKPAASPPFFKSFIHLFVPVAIQNLFFNLIGIFDVLMVGQLGDVPVAAVGLAGQFFFLLNLTLFGITGGAADLWRNIGARAICLTCAGYWACAWRCAPPLVPRLRLRPLCARRAIPAYPCWSR
jgi:hypothetical protein